MKLDWLRESPLVKSKLTKGAGVKGVEPPLKGNFLKIQRKIRSEKNPFSEKSILRKILPENWLSAKSPSEKNPSENWHSANHHTIRNSREQAF